MILLEVRTALRRATKSDLFTGDVNDMNSKQGIKDNNTVFYLDFKTNKFNGPHLVFEYSCFLNLYTYMAYARCGIITPMPNVITNEFLFDLVLREASIDDVKDTPIHIRKNRIYYTYSDKKITGPLYIDNSTTSLYLENLIAKKQLFVPNERQHFEIRSLEKAS